jgi:BlaI family penicillinase repressor
LTDPFDFCRNRIRSANHTHPAALQRKKELPMARPPSAQPTDAELEILKVLWEHGPAGLGPVHAAIQENRPVALTTIATTLKTMLAKGLVVRQDGPRGYVWSAAASRGSTATGLLGKLVHHVFDGSARRLIAHLIQEGALDDRDRDEIRALLEAPKAKGGRR